MKIKSINVSCDGYVNCKSSFYASTNSLEGNTEYTFTTGINKLYGEIDSGAWGISYLISMYNVVPKSNIALFKEPQVNVDDTKLSLKEFSKLCCYLDKNFPLFSTRRTVEQLVKNGIKMYKLNYTAEEIRELFQMTDFRFKRPISLVGNERFKAMAAIGFAHKKQVFCFPWLSQSRFDYYHNNLTDLLTILEKLEKIVILPIGSTIEQKQKSDNYMQY